MDSSLNNFSLIIVDDGIVFSWGNNEYGQLGSGMETNSETPMQVINKSINISVTCTPKQIPYLKNITGIACGCSHSMAINEDGELFTWGRNQFGQLGNGDKTNSPVPQLITNLTNIKLIACGSSHSIAVNRNGELFSWGYNGSGQLGNGNETNSPTPLHITILKDIKYITCGSYHSMAINGNGELFSWGKNHYGELGNGSHYNSPTPVQLSLSDVKSISCGFQHSVAINENGELFSWGNNHYGQLGTEKKSVFSATPQQIIKFTHIISISCGSNHTIALNVNGELFSWGYNGSGQLGNGNNKTSALNQIRNLKNIKYITCGNNHSMAINEDSELFTWGNNGYGELGNGNCMNLPTPQQIKLVGKNLRWKSPEILPIKWEFQRIFWIGKLIDYH